MLGLLASSTIAFANTTSSRLILGLDKAAAQTTKLITQQTGWPVTLHRAMSGNSVVVSIEHGGIDKHALHKQLIAIDGITEVSEDAIVRTTAAVNDPRFFEQWQLHKHDRFSSSIDASSAWDITQGSSEVVVAIVDTGINYNHPDLQGRILPGYDFVSRLSLSVDAGVSVPRELEYLRSHDGDGRDADATDPGDSINEVLRAQFDSIDIECYLKKSTWHGTAMASIIAANPNDEIGIAGIDWNAKILPVRAIGKCGGRRSDMLDAIRWAAGVDDPALPYNPTPARIINLSLGVDDLCTAADQNAINEAINAGAIIVAAVGNNGRNTDAEPSSPSHCQNVIGVMAVDRFGFRSSYSNFGRDADVAAPGGDLDPAINRIIVATDLSENEPSPDYGYRIATGTSVAAPHVSGVLALMLSMKPNLTNQELEALLLDNTRPFSGESDPGYVAEYTCQKSYCGAGLLDALKAVQAVDAHIPGTYLDSPALAAAQSIPVTVGSYASFGCTVTSRTERDPFALLLCLGSVMMLARRTTNLSLS